MSAVATADGHIYDRRPLRGEIVAHGFDLVGEEDELLAAVEVDGEQLAAEVLALRDESPRRGPSNDPAREHDGARRAAARPWNERHDCLLSLVQPAVKVVRSKRAPLMLGAIAVPSALGPGASSMPGRRRASADAGLAAARAAARSSTPTFRHHSTRAQGCLA